MVATATKQLQRSEVEHLVRQVLRERLAGRVNAPVERIASGSAPRTFGAPHPLVVNVSARHIHVTPRDFETLFGAGTSLRPFKPLYQQGEFAAEQRVTLVGPRQRIIPDVRILGPTRDYTQVELSYTDGVYLGIDLPLCTSGHHDGTPGITILGPSGAVTINQGVIRAARHVHMSREDLDHYRVNDGDYMKLRIEGPCGLTFDRIKVRHHPRVILEVHIDTDEGNACDLESATKLELIK